MEQSNKKISLSWNQLSIAFAIIIASIYPTRINTSPKPAKPDFPILSITVDNITQHTRQAVALQDELRSREALIQINEAFVLLDVEMVQVVPDEVKIHLYKTFVELARDATDPHEVFLMANRAQALLQMELSNGGSNNRVFTTLLSEVQFLRAELMLSSGSDFSPDQIAIAMRQSVDLMASGLAASVPNHDHFNMYAYYYAIMAERLFYRDPSVALSCLVYGDSKLRSLEELSIHSEIPRVLGWMYFSLGSLEEAIPHLKTAIYEMKQASVINTPLLTYSYLDLALLYYYKGQCLELEKLNYEISSFLTLHTGMDGSMLKVVSLYIAALQSILKADINQAARDLAVAADTYNVIVEESPSLEDPYILSIILLDMLRAVPEMLYLQVELNELLGKIKSAGYKRHEIEFLTGKIILTQCTMQLDNNATCQSIDYGWLQDDSTNLSLLLEFRLNVLRQFYIFDDLAKLDSGIENLMHMGFDLTPLIWEVGGSTLIKKNSVD